MLGAKKEISGMKKKKRLIFYEGKISSDFLNILIFSVLHVYSRSMIIVEPLKEKERNGKKEEKVEHFLCEIEN